MGIMDIIEIEPDDININNIDIPMFSDNENNDDDFIIKQSTNFGSGIELLMNDKNKNEKKSTNIDIEDISKLEDELNELTSDVNLGSSNNNVKKIGTKYNEPANVDMNNFESEIDENNIGKNTAKIGSLPSKSWDGYITYNDIPNDDKINEKKKIITRR